MEAHVACAKHSLNHNKMLGENNVKLDGREWDLSLRKALLAEVQSQGLNPRDNCEELVEFVELQRLL
jgi:hypothetical protein